jgi:Ran GTPase-activating protein (RanGAP) involved in mRNA processing and transport
MLLSFDRLPSNHILSRSLLSLSSLQHTQVLDLSCNSLGGAEFRSILFGLKTSNLKSLILDNNKFEGDSLKLLAEKIIDSRSCPLVHLCLRQNMLCGSRDRGTFNPEPVIKLSLALCDDSNRNLTHLDLSNCDVGARSAKKLFEALKYNDSITTLDLSYCNISALGGVAVGEALPLIKNLQVLHLKENSIGPVGCEVTRASA